MVAELSKEIKLDKAVSAKGSPLILHWAIAVALGPWDQPAQAWNFDTPPTDKVVVDGQKSNKGIGAIEATRALHSHQLPHQSIHCTVALALHCRGRTLGSTNDAFPSAAGDVAAEQVLLGGAAAAAQAATSSGDQAAYLAGGARAPITTSRRACAATLLVGLAVSAATAVRAEETGSGGAGEEGVIGAIKSIFDPNEKTKDGKVLPKAYLKAAREVVRTLRDSLEEDDGGDIARFRRNADAAKESIREFLGGWRGQQAVAAEESYVALEKAIRSLAEFYSKAGPSASLPQEVKNKILDDLNTAEAYL
ncbi:hypothetical protein EJB05_04503, partial [Eragrostis curvula]